MPINLVDINWLRIKITNPWYKLYSIVYLEELPFVTIIVFLFALLCSIFLFCGPLPVDPNNANNADISLTLTPSSGIKNERLIFDTLGRDIELKIACKFPEFIDSVRVQMFETNNTISVDTVVKIISNLKNDTVTLKFTIKTSGDKNVNLIGYRENKTLVNCTGIIKVFESVKTNTKPQITVLGIKSISSGEKCTLTVAISDSVAVRHKSGCRKPWKKYDTNG